MAKLKKQKKQVNVGKDITTSFLQYEAVLLPTLICLILPLALKDGYYKVGEFKFHVYGWLAGIGLVISLLTLIPYAFFTWKEWNLKEDWKNLSVTDRFVIAYLIFTLVSYFLNNHYLKENLMGYPGWYMGLYAQVTFVLLYFILSRFAKDYVIVIATLAGTSFLAYIFGILHRMLIDPLHTYEGIDPKYYNFLSTLGQSSWYSSFLCTFLPFMMGLYLIGQKKWLHILSGIFCMVGFTTLVSQNSDSAYLAMTGTFMVLGFISVKDGKRMRRLIELAWGLFAAGKIMRLLLLISPN
ncbi:MAG: hypothetical protein IK078_08650, partial [Lachnospiraceae bacterium]|nr:hypothetical protein [Lachnospiraceae bacterium]